MIGHMVSSLYRYVRTPAARSAEEFGNEIEEEISFHLAQRAGEYAASGMSEQEARRKALERFGNASRYAAECHLASVKGLATWHRLHLAVTVGLVAAVGWLWFRSTGPHAGSLAGLASLPPGIASMLDNDWTGDVQGRLVDERGQPIASAHVLVVVKTWPDQSYFQRAYTAISGLDGRFVIENVHPMNERYAVQIAAVADNRVLKSSYHQLAGGPLKPLEFELPPSSSFGLKVEDDEGAVFSGVEVLPHGRVEADGDEHIVYFDSAQPIIRVTNADGRVELPYFRPGDTATVMLRVPNGEWESREVVVPANGRDATVRASSHRELQLKES
jgi:hypothetical protein